MAINPNKRYLNEDVVKHAYESTVECCARLSAFAYSQPPEGDTEVGNVQVRLAIDDLIRFSIHARRLLVSTKTVDKAKSRFINIERAIAYGDDVKFETYDKIINMWDIFGIVIHSEFVEIFRKTFEIKLHIFYKDEMTERLTKALQGDISFSPRIFIISDKNSAFVEIGKITALFIEILSEIVDICNDNRLFLEHDF